MNDSSDSIKVATSILYQMLLYLQSKRISTRELLQNLNIDETLLDSPDLILPIDTYLKIEAEAAILSNDPFFGLHVGEYAEAGSWSILGYVMMNCKNLGEALQKACRYSRIIGNFLEPKIYIDENTASIRYTNTFQTVYPSRHCIESSLSTSIRLMRTITGKLILPQEVELSSAYPESLDEYQRIFGCLPQFCQPENVITLDKSVLDYPVLMPSQQLLAYFENVASDLLEQYERNNEYSTEVARIILSYIDNETLSIEFVAGKLAVSVRTLQNRLKAEGTFFSEQLKNIRLKLAQKYLSENYTIEQITYLLGFSEPAAFRKAFKKWTGLPPRHYYQGTRSKLLSQ